jgi:hypothetical protein
LDFWHFTQRIIVMRACVKITQFSFRILAYYGTSEFFHFTVSIT